MTYFANFLSLRAHILRFPRQHTDDVQRYVRQHQKSSFERAPFRRQLDFWAFCVTVALARELTPREKPSSKWGTRFVDTRQVSMPETLCDLLAVAAFAHLSPDGEFDDPAQIIEVGNCFAGAACPLVLEHLDKLDLRLTPMEKALDYAASTLEDTADR